ncbi:MAG: pyridoxal phosphate-dependent aminotransferase [Myxococcota bacterium]
MPRPPYVNSHISAMPSGVFSKFSGAISQLKPPIYPLHIGDTYLEPALGARMEDIRTESFVGVHRYTRSEGLPSLIKAISLQKSVDSERVLITAGATGGLHVLAMTLLEPGDEVLILAPYWPLIAGIVRSVGAIPIEVPFFDRPGSVQDRLAPYVTAKTTALYINSPNNPTGFVLDHKQACELAQIALDVGIWIWSDEVYESLQFSGISLDLPSLAPDHTFSVFSFSKIYGMAGNRVGYIIGPSAELMVELSKAQKHTYYSVTTAAQYAALQVLDCGQEWLANAKKAYGGIGTEVAHMLDLPSPKGGTFLFIDVSKYLDSKGVDGFLEECISHGLLLAPGESFGVAYAQHIRLCFTSAPPNVVREGVQILKKIMADRLRN